jgi:hypothetical protein
MVIKPEHKEAASAILKEIAKKAKEIHHSEFKSKYQKGGEDEADGGLPEDHPGLDAEETSDLHDGGDEPEDLADGEEGEGEDDKVHGHPDLIALRKLAKKHK